MVSANRSNKRRLSYHDSKGRNIKILHEDHRFSFACDQCGNCCHGADIPLDPYDILKISDYFGTTTQEFMEEFTHWVVAPSFGIPIVLLNTKPCCPFNREGLCNIYQVRPFLCRSYPVIRIVTYNLRKDKIEVKYGLEKNCSSIKTSETQTIRQWLTEQCGDTYLQESLRWSEFKLHLAGAEYTNDKVFQLLFYATVYASEPSEDEMKAMGISKQSTPEEKSRAKLDFVSRLDWAYATEAVKADGAFAEDRVEPNKQRNADSPTSVKMPYIRFEP